VAINIVGVSGKNFSSLGKIVVCPEKCFDSQNGTLTENFFGDGGGGGGLRKQFLSRGPKVAEKGPRHKICLRARVPPLRYCVEYSKCVSVRAIQLQYLGRYTHQTLHGIVLYSKLFHISCITVIYSRYIINLIKTFHWHFHCPFRALFEE
jgi:hypothetical protein